MRGSWKGDEWFWANGKKNQLTDEDRQDIENAKVPVLGNPSTETPEEAESEQSQD